MMRFRRPPNNGIYGTASVRPTGKDTLGFLRKQPNHSGVLVPSTMKKTILLLGALAVSAVSQARTWTSANGENTFEADYLSNDANTVTVLRNGKKVIFKIELLSKEDRTWIEAEAKKAVQADADKKAAAEFSKSDFGKALGKMQKLDGKKFSKHELEAAPKLFLLYFSASW